jgi:hypothetical protein
VDNSRQTKLLPISLTIKTISTRHKRRELEEIEQRFEAFPDPFNNWIVWDRIEDDFAEVGSRRLRSLSEGQAKGFCFLLNRLLSKRRELDYNVHARFRPL